MTPCYHDMGIQRTIDGILFLVLLYRLLCNRLRDGHSSIRHEDIEFAKVRNHLVDTLLDSTSIGNLHLVSSYKLAGRRTSNNLDSRFGCDAVLLAKLLASSDCGVIAIVPQGYIAAGLCHCFSDSESDAICGSIDCNHFAFHAELLEHIFRSVRDRLRLSWDSGFLN